MTDHDALITEARKLIEHVYNGETAYIGLHIHVLESLADALEAATVAPGVNREALADIIGNVYNREHYDPAHRAADAVIASGLLADRAVVEAQDLERAAAAALYLAESWPGKPGSAELGEPWLLNADAELSAEWSAWVADHDRLVEAQALEQAVDAYYSDREKGLIGNTTEWLLKRAVEIREGRQ